MLTARPLGSVPLSQTAAMGLHMVEVGTMHCVRRQVAGKLVDSMLPPEVAPAFAGRDLYIMS